MLSALRRSAQLRVPRMLLPVALDAEQLQIRQRVAPAMRAMNHVMHVSADDAPAAAANRDRAAREAARLAAAVGALEDRHSAVLPVGRVGRPVAEEGLDEGAPDHGRVCRETGTRVSSPEESVAPISARRRGEPLANASHALALEAHRETNPFRLDFCALRAADDGVDREQQQPRSRAAQ